MDSRLASANALQMSGRQVGVRPEKFVLHRDQVIDG
jgi:hypothetical protein